MIRMMVQKIKVIQEWSSSAIVATVFCGVCLLFSSIANAQQLSNTQIHSRIKVGSMNGARRLPKRIRDYSWIHIDEPKPREIKVHDIVTIIVDEKSEVTSNNRYNRQRNAQLKAELKDFLRIGEDGNLKNAASNQPGIEAQVSSRLQSFGQMTDQEGIRYRIAATVVDVLPNGTLILEARKSIRTNRDVWEYSLTGRLRSEDILRDNTALSENIADLKIDRDQRGKIFDSTRRPWGIYLIDKLFPF
jgi:flagellar L-ring protein precursor FlgH